MNNINNYKILQMSLLRIIREINNTKHITPNSKNTTNIIQTNIDNNNNNNNTNKNK